MHISSRYTNVTQEIDLKSITIDLNQVSTEHWSWHWLNFIQDLGFTDGD